ncbi:hypothetical protein PLESTB_000017900 [Pleodorina starrii]|uniref:Uncharacterized protein n=1 Tax=Pleodorina starrii TaxID=330485 RepID=A0A9W6EVG4_9CHLO|nr:hypothetical protein PLESTB_000017900 [Pleodorina starrii]GLC70875.1 hypothetical protein PLESTF_001042300 [Pleodorina starrii]
MAQCDLEKANEPFVVLFSRLAPDVIRSGAAVPNSLAPSRNSLEALPPAGDVSATEFWRVKALRRAIEEARDKLNPRFVMLVSVQQPWLWTFVFLRAHDQLRPALHRLAPNAAQLLADQRQVVTPGLTILDDLTPGQEVVQRLRPRIAHELRPLLLWMGNEDMEANERVVVLYTCADVQLLRQLFIVAPEERSSRVAATGDAVGMEDLGDAELQRTLLARDRLYDVVDVLRPRLLVLINWLLDPDRWLLVLCRRAL